MKLFMIVLSALFFPGSIMGQQVVDVEAGTIYYTEGTVYADGQVLQPTPFISGGGIPVQKNPATFARLKAGQVLQADEGLAEVVLGPSIFLRIAQRSAVRLIRTHLEDVRVEIQRGTALLEVVRLQKGNHIHILHGDTSTDIKSAGLFRFDLAQRQLRVFGGKATVEAHKKVSAGRGTAVSLESTALRSKFDTTVHDMFHRWAAARSFYLFSVTMEARNNPTTHWEASLNGWAWNRYFGTRLFSPTVATDYARRRRGEKAIWQPLDRAQDQLKVQDQIQRQKEAEEQRRRSEQGSPKP